MKEKELEKKLRQSLQAYSAAYRPQRLISAARAEAARRSCAGHMSFSGFLLKQIRYVGWKLWAAQGLLLLLFERIMQRLFNEYFWESPLSVVRVLICMSILIAMSTPLLLYRAARYRMQEIEAAAYFSSVRLLMAKLAVIGAGDVLLLLSSFMIAAAAVPLRAVETLLYLCLPFLLISCVYLFMLSHCKGRHFLSGGMALGAVMLVLTLGTPDRLVLLLRPATLPTGFIVCAVLAVFSAVQLGHLLRSSRYTELQIM